jgi:hypothetical protein
MPTFWGFSGSSEEEGEGEVQLLEGVLRCDQGPMLQNFFTAVNYGFSQ